MRIALVIMIFFVFCPGFIFGQGTRKVTGLVISSGDKTPMPGFTIYPLGTETREVLSDVNGRFEIDGLVDDTVYLILRGPHYEKYVRYYPGESFQTFIVYEPEVKRLRRENEKIKREYLRKEKSKH